MLDCRAEAEPKTALAKYYHKYFDIFYVAKIGP